MQAQRLPHVVIIGGGFGGLYAAKSLRRAPVHITLIDRANHHLFQPLLYEVATAALSPADIAAPIRRVLSRQRNTTVLLGRATSVDTANRIVHLADGQIDYDYLIVASGATHSYFGKSEWAKFAPGLKTIEDALEIRRRFLLAFEAAEREADADARRAKLTFIVVGGGPTGVELAGTMSELARRSIPRDFRAIDTTTARVILVEAEDRVLTTFPRKLSERAKRDLQRLGVEVRLNSRVTEIDNGGVVIGTAPTSERIDAENVIWAAGVQASPLGATLGAPVDRHGRVQVNPDLSIPDHPEVFVIGDLARIVDPMTNHEVPGVAPAAIQMGRHVAKVIEREIRTLHDELQVANDELRMTNDGVRVSKEASHDSSLVARRSSLSRPAFHYIDKGMLATIGRAKAVGTIFGIKVVGTLAWLMWAGIHVLQLIGFRNRLIVMLQWGWAYLVFQRGARLITGPTDLYLHKPRTDDMGIAPVQTSAVKSTAALR